VNNFAKDAGCLSVLAFTARIGFFVLTSCTTRLRVLIGIPCSARMVAKLCGNSFEVGSADKPLIKKMLANMGRINFREFSLMIMTVFTKTGWLLIALLQFCQFFRTRTQVLKSKFIEWSFNSIFIFNKICLALVNIKQTS